MLVWVSGGPDSVCLLESLVRLRRLFRIRLAVFHMDHGLRADSASDAVYVRRLAARHGLDCFLGVPLEPPAARSRWSCGPGWNGSARPTRSPSEIGATRHADGHTMDDQAETILLGLVLGWGLDGLGGIAPARGRLVRPLLDVTREEVEAFCRSLRLSPRRDPTNADKGLLRNAIRLEAIPAIERATGRAVTRTFARTADHLRRDAEALLEQAEAQAPAILGTTERGFSVAAGPVQALAPAIGSRVVRLGFQRRASRGTSTPSPRSSIWRRVPGPAQDLPSGATARRDRTHVHVER